MSTNIAKFANEGTPYGFIVEPPRSSDSISGALHAAFGRQDEMSDEFAALLYRIDIADRRENSFQRT